MSGAADDGAATGALPVEIILAETGARRRRPRTVVTQPVSLAAERAEAPRLYRVLQEVPLRSATGTHSWATVEAEAMTELERHGWRPDYVTVRRRADLLPPKTTTVNWSFWAPPAGAPSLDNLD